MKIRLGDRVWKTPYALRENGKDKLLEGTVIWIHPKGRFYVLRFDLPGGSFCESFSE
ncbi:MAG: hypothetical protein J5482_02865 [Oscillospiraceae bacterium]|nr:hypothetical protein [Oscillospiraceae bacterium]